MKPTTLAQSSHKESYQLSQHAASCRDAVFIVSIASDLTVLGSGGKRDGRHANPGQATV